VWHWGYIRTMAACRRLRRVMTWEPSSAHPRQELRVRLRQRPDGALAQFKAGHALRRWRLGPQPIDVSRPAAWAAASSCGAHRVNRTCAAKLRRWLTCLEGRKAGTATVASGESKIDVTSKRASYFQLADQIARRSSQASCTARSGSRRSTGSPIRQASPSARSRRRSGSWSRRTDLHRDRARRVHHPEEHYVPKG
jgi:hypothetical protein